MSVRELGEWTAFEKVYGPILPHERIDLGFTKLTYYLVSAFTERRKRPKWWQFLPDYLQKLGRQQASNAEELRVFFEGLVDADNQHPNR